MMAGDPLIRLITLFSAAYLIQPPLFLIRGVRGQLRNAFSSKNGDDGNDRQKQLVLKQAHHRQQLDGDAAG
jgi:hypothetical protein